jgi:hypothetical protein
MTKGGRCLKGEGTTDSEALAQIALAARDAALTEGEK